VAYGVGATGHLPCLRGVAERFICGVVGRRVVTWDGLTPPYRTVVADPPWQVAAGPRSLHDPGERTRLLRYSTMSVAEIAALPVGVGALAELDKALSRARTDRSAARSDP
jgi:hypothetical protein